MLWGVLTSGCSAGMSAVGLTECDNSMTCCIKKFPLDPAGACGASTADIQAAVAAGVVMGTVLQRRADDGAGEGEKADDPDEGWQEHCRDNYVLCKSQKKPQWIGPCYDCLRLCEGQRQWPFHMCWQKAR